MLNEVLQPSYTNFIGSPVIIRYSYPPVLRVVVIPALVVVLPLEDEEGGLGNPRKDRSLIRLTRLSSSPLVSFDELGGYPVVQSVWHV